MAFHKHFERLRRMHRMIQFRRTGTPQSFALKMDISLSLLYKLLAEMKEMGAPVHYCHVRQSYEYYERVELRLGFDRLAIPAGEAEATGKAVIVSLSSPKTAC